MKLNKIGKTEQQSILDRAKLEPSVVGESRAGKLNNERERGKEWVVEVEESSGMEFGNGTTYERSR